ncbi:MAG TPA: GtrA family protein [Rhizomicrobium sp.]|nr:GtrA family protein [Rhizomicrobium sp.]
MNAEEIARRVSRSQFLRFAVVGTAGFAVNEAALFALLKALHLDPYSGQAIAFLFAATFTWWGNRRLTFRAQAAATAQGMAREWAKFIAANALGGAVNYAIYAALVTFAPAPFDSPFLGVVAGTLVGLAFNFTMSKRFVFRT